MIIKYFYPDFIPNFDKINSQIKHKEGKYTFPPQLAILIDLYGVKTKCYSSEDIKKFDEDFDQFKRWFGKNYEHELKYISQESFDWMVSEFRKKNLFEVKETRFEDLLALFNKGYLVSIPIDWNTLNGKKGPYEGHFILIAGIDGNSILIHDPDVGSNIKYSLNKIKEAWSHPSIAQDYIVAYKKK